MPREATRSCVTEIVLWSCAYSSKLIKFSEDSFFTFLRYTIVPPPVGDTNAAIIWTTTSTKSKSISHPFAWRINSFSCRHQNCCGYVVLHLQAHIAIIWWIYWVNNENFQGVDIQPIVQQGIFGSSRAVQGSLMSFLSRKSWPWYRFMRQSTSYPASSTARVALISYWCRAVGRSVAQSRAPRSSNSCNPMRSVAHTGACTCILLSQLMGHRTSVFPLEVEKLFVVYLFSSKYFSSLFFAKTTLFHRCGVCETAQSGLRRPHAGGSSKLRHDQEHPVACFCDQWGHHLFHPVHMCRLSHIYVRVSMPTAKHPNHETRSLKSVKRRLSYPRDEKMWAEQHLIDHSPIYSRFINLHIELCASVTISLHGKDI